MTIYAIINELTDTQESQDPTTPIWTIVSSNCILQGGNPYFVPDFANTFELRTALAVKIGKLGKSIPARFAHRYISGVAPCLMMVATDMIERLKSAGHPWTQAISYDRSTAFGTFSELPTDRISKCAVEVSLETAGNEKTLKWTAESLPYSIEKTIESISRDNTLKTGDIIIIGIDRHGYALHPGMRATMALDGVQSPGFNIR